MSCSGNAIAAENETARPESRKYRASCRARHTVRRLEPRKNSTALDAQELTPRVRIPRRRTGVQGGVVSRNWRNNFHHKRRYGPAQAVLGTAVRRAKARSIFRRELRNGQSECAIVQVCDRAGPTFGRYVVAVWSRKSCRCIGPGQQGLRLRPGFRLGLPRPEERFISLLRQRAVPKAATSMAPRSKRRRPEIKGVC